MKKIAVVIYPYFSLQEITTLTSALKIWFNKDIDFLGSKMNIYESEEGFRVMPSKIFSDVNIDDYSCIIFPGIINPMPALFDEELIDFTSKLKNRDILIASISSSPLLLAKAGVLDEVKFTAGFFMQMADIFDFINKKNFIHQPVVKDKNVITAIGFAFREFAQSVLNELGLDVGETFMYPVTKKYSEEELTFYFEDADYKEFLQELQQYENKGDNL